MTDVWDRRDEVEVFLERLIQGAGRTAAAVEAGWSGRQLTTFLRDDEFATLVYETETRRNETVEQVLFTKAMAGHMEAIKMWLFNRSPERWSDRKHIDVNGHIEAEVGVTLGVKQAVHELLTEHGPAALQIGGVLDDPEIQDAEIVEDDGN